MQNLLIEPTVGYMLKIMKQGLKLTKFKEEFAAIRHGNYDEFIQLIGEPKPFVIGTKDGVISNQNEMSQKSHCDFVGLMLAGPSLRQFFDNCVNEYGVDLGKYDDEIPNSIYGKVALFELSIRMHANNYSLIGNKENLVDVIEEIGEFKNLSQITIDKLQKGRQFINDIKHHNEPEYKRKFESWTDGMRSFMEAYQIIEYHQLTII